MNKAEAQAGLKRLQEAGYSEAEIFENFKGEWVIDAHERPSPDRYMLSVEEIEYFFQSERFFKKPQSR